MRIQWASLLLACTLGILPAQQPIPVFLDTDMGDDIDDALALAFALQSPELDIRGVSTVLHHADRRADLTWRILELYGRTDIRVGLGAEEPLLARVSPRDVKQAAALPENYHIPAARTANGLKLIIDTIMSSREKITVLAYGPLTNIALALRAEPRLKTKLERIVLMNGVFFRSGIEYNTYMDPEASAIVYDSGVPVAAVGLDVTMQCRLSPEHLIAMENSASEGVRFLRQLIGIWQNGKPDQMPILHDPLAILVTVQPSLVEFATGRVDVETKGTPRVSYGLTAFTRDASGKVRVASTVRAADAVKLFFDRVSAPPRSLNRR